MIGASATERLVREVRAALRRRPVHEARLAGTLRALAVVSPELRGELCAAVETSARRGSFQRPLYCAGVRSLGEQGDSRLVPILKEVLASEDAGGLASLAAACSTRDESLSEPLARVAGSRHPNLAFAAEVARLVRGEPRGDSIASLAPRIKEAHRISLCGELFSTLLSRAPLPLAIAPALAVLRGSERHLGRWLLLGELATRAGDLEPSIEAEARARSGPNSSRAAWSLVAWALAPERPPPAARPSLELMARLSDRPSADRDVAFLFRLATARVQSAKPVLEQLAGSPGGSEVSVRAALHLFRDYGQEQQVSTLLRAGHAPRKAALRGLAAAALYDCGQAPEAQRLLSKVESSAPLAELGWALLVRATEAGVRAGRLVSEQNFRRMQQGVCA